MKEMLARSPDAANGKLFRAFIALILTAHIETGLEKRAKGKSWTVSQADSELEKIRARKAKDGCKLENPIANAQAEMPGRYDLTAEDAAGRAEKGLARISVLA